MLRKLAWLMAGAAGASIVLLGWALLWPEEFCTQPACARKRFTLAIEIDAFRNVAPIAFEVPTHDGRVSLRSILAAGGIDVRLAQDQLDLPYKAASGALDRADLYQFAQAWRSKKLPKGTDAKVYALLTTALISDTGEPLFGIMFDTIGREGFAVAPATTIHRFGDREPESIETLQLRTFAHELLHALNRRHLDAVQMTDGRLTLEAPTRCISGQKSGQWFLREAPLMALSPSTIHFFQTAAHRDVLPGKEGSPFQLRRASPTECDDARSTTAADPAGTRWELAARRLRQVLSIRAASAADEAEEPAEDRIDEEEPASTQDTELAPAPVDLRIQALPSAYPLGYPIALRIMAYNAGTEPLPIKGRLMLGYGVVRIEYRRAEQDESQWQVLQPLAWFEPIDDKEAMLAPGEWTEQTEPIYFGEDGWTFAEPGEYQVRARLQTGDGVQDAVSTAVTLNVEEVRAPDDLAALQPLLDENGQLDDDVGRLLTFGGRIGSEEDIAPLEAAAEEYGHTAIGGALRLTLISQRLRPPIDPLTGERPTPDFGDARELLKETCTDSGLAALKSQLLMRHAGGIPDMSNRAETGATAWDGTTTMRGKTMATYSDPSLQLWGPSLHFCFDESQPRVPVRTGIGRLVAELRREKPARIVLVGHGDREGTCRYNDGLGLRRAESVRRALIDAGARVADIQVASLGERRPLDFSSTGPAHDLNRRVEILVESAAPSAAEQTSPQRIAPRCPARETQRGVTARNARITSRSEQGKER